MPAALSSLSSRSGRLWAVEAWGPLAGGGPDVCELRKMYFLPRLRGSGQGTRFLKTILDAARKAGYTTCYLETMDAMAAARQLYLKHGFEPIESPFGQYRARQLPALWQWMPGPGRPKKQFSGPSRPQYCRRK